MRQNLFLKRNKTMKNLKLIAIAAILLTSSMASAEVSIISRANCFPPGGIDLGNESISWEVGKAHWLRVQSKHSMGGRERHTRTTGWEYTWNNNYTAHKDTISQRLWSVKGTHWGWDSKEGTEFVIGYTSTDNCNF
ncbi:hypothetical protein BMR09_15485 [Methylococcaceae bacterium CS3]|nr:hypothetical protein BMR09_15485 [Methylococcaceae bacterium CS3]